MAKSQRGGKVGPKTPRTRRPKKRPATPQSKARRDEVAKRLQLEVLNNIPAVAWTVTPNGQCDFINRFYLDATGLSLEYCLTPFEQWKKGPNDLPPFLSPVHPDHRERTGGIFWNGIRSGRGWSFEAPFLHADGVYRWHFDRAVPLRDARGNLTRFVGTCADIEELKVAQENLVNSEKRLDAIIDGSPSLIFLKDLEGRYLLVNREFERSFGLHRDKIIGRTDRELFVSGQAAAFRGDDLRVLEAGVPMRFEETAQTVDGLRHSVVQKFPLLDSAGHFYATGGVAFDITDRKRAEEDLQESEERARLIVETALDAVITMDNLGTIVGWTAQAERMFGWSRAEALGQLLSELIIPQIHRQAHQAGLKRFLSTGEGPLLNRRIEVAALHRDGHEFPVELTVSPMKVRRTWAFSAFIRDLTERRRTEEALRETQSELARVARLTSMGELTASIAHEINQPLAAIVIDSKTCLNWLSAAQPDHGKAVAAAKRMLNEAIRTSEIIAHIRSLMTKAEPERVPVDVNGLIRDVLSLIEFRKHQIELRTELSESLPRVRGDRVQLQQVILNLALNAVEAMLPVRDRARKLSIGSRIDDSKAVLIRVQDTGVGITSELTERIFAPFFTTKINGTGMGLSICRSIVEAHEGRLSVMPGSPHGAVFQLHLAPEATQDHA
jgi:PAS domain S-box-containing protein